MDVAIFAVVLIGLTAFVAAPLYARRPEGDASLTDPQRLDPAERGRESLLRALRDLEIDRASGLIDDASYPSERAVLEAEVAGFAASPEPSD